MGAFALARAGLKVRIIDKLAQRIFNGNADGIQASIVLRARYTSC
jgi:hypothetical protein